jgi:[acyl-carrier-protein] S-malonyltransferase
MPRTVFLFPGQGAQKVGMGKSLHDSLPAARQLFDEAAEILGYSLADVCFNGPADRLNSTAISQPALYVASLAALEQLKVNEPQAIDECIATAGLSLGEYTALAFAGALTFRDGLKLVQQRGQAMQEAADAMPSGMVALIGMEEKDVRALVDAARPAGTIEIANLLCPGNIVVSGIKAACEAFQKLAEEKGARTIPLAVAGAFHTSVMKPADEKLAAALAKVEIRPPRVPVWSNVDARPHTDPAEIRQLLVQQVVSPVLMEKSLRGLLDEAKGERFYEIGPGTVVSGLLKRIHRKADLRQVGA